MALARRLLAGPVQVSFNKTFTTSSNVDINVLIVNESQQVPPVLLRAKREASKVHSFPGRMYFALRATHYNRFVRDPNGEERPVEYGQVLDLETAARFFGTEATVAEFREQAQALTQNWNDINGDVQMQDQ